MLTRLVIRFADLASKSGISVRTTFCLHELYMYHSIEYTYSRLQYEHIICSIDAKEVCFITWQSAFQSETTFELWRLPMNRGGKKQSFLHRNHSDWFCFCRRLSLQQESIAVQPSVSSGLYYKTRKNRCVILNYCKFDVRLPNRSDDDAQKLKTTFEARNFEVIIKPDLTRDKTIEALDKGNNGNCI